jgi:hypothetical protein
VGDHIALGVAVSWSHGESTTVSSSGVQADNSSTSFGVAPRFGFQVPLGGAFSLFPRAAVAIGSVSSDQRSTAGENQHDQSRTWLWIDAPVVAEVAPHLIVGVGPYVTTDLSRTDQTNYDNRGTTLGLSGLVGGWL